MKKSPVTDARPTPITLVAWNRPDAAARARVGNVSATSAAATAHSPPVPIATRNRSTWTCQRVWTKYVSAEKIE